MLRGFLRAVACLALLLGALMTTTGGAAADPTPPGGSVEECHNSSICVGANDPGSPGGTPAGSGGGGGGGSATCHWYGQEVPCHLSDAGWFNSADGCYYKKSDPQPAAGSEGWQGHDPSGGGAVYDRMCRAPDGNTITGAPPVWLAGAPAGTPPPDPAELAQQAMKQLPFAKPVLRTAPGKDGSPLVGLPLWLWYDKAEGTYGQVHRTVTAGNVTVTATATLRRVDWHMGDGHDAEPCKGPGTPYEARYGGAESPDCGYRYTASSAGRPGEQFTVSATLHWYVTATVEGAPANIPPIEDFTTDSELLQLRVGELQVLN